MNQKMKKWRAPALFALCLLPFAAVGGWCTGSYSLASYPEELRQSVLAQLGGAMPLYFLSAIQSVMMTFICGAVGYALSRAVGLMRPLRLQKSKLLPTLGITLGCGVFFSQDYWTFGRWLPQVAQSYENGLLIRRPDNWLASVFYGGIIEEVLLRLFLMSLVAFLIWKLFFRKCSKNEIPQGVFVAANVLCALLFAAGHLPATITMFGTLTPLVLLRCFLLNGGLGLVFGWLYRRYGIQYAMIGHAGAHIISKLIWLALI